MNNSMHPQLPTKNTLAQTLDCCVFDCTGKGRTIIPLPFMQYLRAKRYAVRVPCAGGPSVVAHRLRTIDNGSGFRQLDIPTGKSAVTVNPFSPTVTGKAPFFRQHNPWRNPK